MRRFLISVPFLLLATFSSSQATTEPDPNTFAVAEQRYELEPLPFTFDKPVALLAVPDDGDRLLVVELGGLIIAVDDSAPRQEPFLNLVRRVTALQGEQGLFSVAVEDRSVASRYGRERFAFAAYTERDSGDLVVGRYPLDGATGNADAGSELIVLRVPMPEPFHHGGQVAFGPDGMLYVGIGNGESSNRFLHERPWSAPSLGTLRGKVVRLDVSGGWDTPVGYAVPPDNPHVSTPGASPEVYASGFRNPWKFHFDTATGDLYLADVGNDRYEEINLVTPGADHGWPSMEGFECQWFPDAEGFVDPDCPERTFAAPLVAYGHLSLDPQGGQAVTGGVVSRDPTLPDLHGAYVYGDFVLGRVWALYPSAESPVALVQAPSGLTSFALGPHGELLLSFISGPVAKIVPISGTP